MNITAAQQNLFRRQILIVLADYQNTMPATCPKCFRPLRPATDSAVVTRARIENRDDVTTLPNANKYCVACGADAYGFARGESVRTEVADRIIENLKLCAKSDVR